MQRSLLSAGALRVNALFLFLACSRTELDVREVDTGPGAPGPTLRSCITSLICPPFQRCEAGTCIADIDCPAAFLPRMLAETSALGQREIALQWLSVSGHEYLTPVSRALGRSRPFLSLETGAVTHVAAPGTLCNADLAPCYQHDGGTELSLSWEYRLQRDEWIPSQTLTVTLPVHSASFHFHAFPDHFFAYGWSAAGDGLHELFRLGIQGQVPQRLVRTPAFFTTRFGPDGSPAELFMNQVQDGIARHAVAAPAVEPDWQDLFVGGTNLTGLIPLPDGAYALVHALPLAEIPTDRAYPTWAVWKLRPGHAQRLGYVSLPPLRDLYPLYSRFHYGRVPLVQGRHIQGTFCDSSGSSGVCRLLRLELEPVAIQELSSVVLPHPNAWVTSRRNLSCGAEEVVITTNDTVYLARLAP